jgi:hypothetical protein
MAKGLNNKAGLSIFGADSEKKAEEYAGVYNAARIQTEGKYPVVAAFNLDLSRGVDLDGVFKRLLESPAAMIGPQITEKLDNISKTRNTVWEKLSRIWGFPGIVSLAKSEMALEPKSHLGLAIDDRLTEEKEDYTNRQLAIGAVVLALTALAPFTGGTTGVVATVIGAAMTAESIQEAMLQQAASGTDFEKARAISKEEPNWYWVAAEIIATAVDLKGALTEFKVLLTLKREAMAAKVAAQASKDVTAFEKKVAELKVKGNDLKTKQPGLGDRIEQEVRVKSATADDLKPPVSPDSAPATIKDPNVLGAKPGFALTYKDEIRAHAVYNDWIKVRPNEEVGLAYCPKTEEWTVVHGTKDEIKFPSNMFTDQAGNPWTIVKHYHPGKEVLTRVPSIEDFKALSNLHEGKAWESVVEYLHPVTGQKRYTYFGYDPAKKGGQYWVKYMAPSESGVGTLVEKQFARAPHTDGNIDYRNFLNSIETKNKEILQGATTARPGG